MSNLTIRRHVCWIVRVAFETRTLSIEVNKYQEASKIIYTVPFNSNIWAYHDSRLWSRADRLSEPTNDLAPALTEYGRLFVESDVIDLHCSLTSAFSLVLPLDEIEYEYGKKSSIRSVAHADV